MLLLTIILLCLRVHAQHPPHTGRDWGNITRLVDALKDGAMCLDGSPPVYYFRNGIGNGVNKWLLFYEGGGWCGGLMTTPSTAFDSCYNRSFTYLGSSRMDGWDLNMTYAALYMSPDPKINPTFYNWNTVAIRYCDGASFTGDSDVTVPLSGPLGKVTLHFRGFRITQAIAKDLITNRNMGSATDVMVSGCSAGGLAVYHQADFWTNQLPNAKVRAFADAGYFIDVDYNQQHFSDGFQWIFNEQGSMNGVNQDCISFYKSSAAGADQNKLWKCFFPEHEVKFIKTPIFAQQSAYDSWQIVHEMNPQGYPQPWLSLADKYAADFRTRFYAFTNKTENGCMLDSCFHHCGNGNQCKFDSEVIDGMNCAQALNAWYYQSGGSYMHETNTKLVWQC